MRDHTVTIDRATDCGLDLDHHHRATCRDCGWTSYCGNLTYATEAGLQHRDNLPALALSERGSTAVRAVLAVQAIVCLVLTVLLLTAGSDKPCGNPAGLAGTLTTVDTHHGQYLTEDSPGWRTHCQ